MIRPVAGGGLPPTEFAAPTASDAPAAHALPASDPTTARAGDPLARLYELVGASPHDAHLYSDKGGGRSGAQVRQSNPLIGAQLPGQKDVVIQREVGDPKGYDTRNHALAWARAMGSDAAMVVQGQDKRWHAVETNRVGQSAHGGTGKVLTAIPVGKVDPQRYQELRSAAMKDNDPEKWKDFASYALGVPRDEINVVTGNKEPSRTMVNINLTRDFNAEGKAAGFDPVKPPWVQLGPQAFDRPANACATLAHEEVHADHHRETKSLHDDFVKFKESHPKNKDSFREWVVKEADKVAAKEKTDPMKVFQAYRRAEIVAGMQDGTFAATELEAHVEAAKLAYASGDLAQARTDLNKVATLATMPSQQTKEVSIAVLQRLREGLDGEALKVFDEVAKGSRPNNVLRDPTLRPR